MTLCLKSECLFNTFTSLFRVVSVSNMSQEKLSKYLSEFGQNHLIRFWPELSDDQKKYLEENINNINISEAVSYFKTAVQNLDNDIEKLDEHMTPIPSDNYGCYENTSEEIINVYKNKGLDLISRSKVGILLMAGGQGTRLGVPFPKGMYNVGLLSKKTLFHLQAERILKLQQLAEKVTKKSGIITWYIMASEQTVVPTEQYLKENNYFGLRPKNILIFTQGKLPCFDFQGNILLSQKHEVSQSPDGNGGLYRALKDQKIIEDMQNHQIEYIHVHSVDNILVQVGDPVFIGFCAHKVADCGAKVVKKVVPTEAVGVVCKVNDVFQVVEYSEITEKTSKLKTEQGELVFNAGNICNHFFTVEFLKSIGQNHESELKLHVAKKKIPYVNENGELVKPTIPNGIKIEKFIFDVFQFTEKFVVWNVPRNVEFSALKNADDAKKDCPSTARNDLYALHRKYLENAGAVLTGEEFEISPLLSYSGEGLEEYNGQVLTAPCLLKAKNEE